MTEEGIGMKIIDFLRRLLRNENTVISTIKFCGKINKLIENMNSLEEVIDVFGKPDKTFDADEVNELRETKNDRLKHVHAFSTERSDCTLAVSEFLDGGISGTCMSNRLVVDEDGSWKLTGPSR